MARITVEDCLEKIPNRFQLALAAVKRAKMLLRGARPLVDSTNKEIVTSLREIAAGEVRVKTADGESAGKGAGDRRENSSAGKRRETTPSADLSPADSRAEKEKKRKKPTRPSRRAPAPSDSAGASAPASDDADVLEPEVVEDDWVLEDAAQATRESLPDGSRAHGDDAEGAPELALLPPSSGAGALVTRDALGAYLAQIRQIPVLSREEEHELAVRHYETGDLDAAYKLVTANLRLVVMIAREYQRAFHNLLDLVQEGNVGLLEAVKNFDPYRGVRLPSYAVWWIRAYIIRYVMNNFRLVKVGTTQAQRRLFFNLQKEKARLEAKGFTPTPKLIARNLGVKEKEVQEMDIRMGSSEVSVDAPVQPGSDTPVVELMAEADGGTAEDEVADREFYALMRLKLDEFGSTLEGRDLEIFQERLMTEEPLTLQEIGERWGVSRERVRQIEEALKKRLREFLVAQVRDVPDNL